MKKEDPPKGIYGYSKTAKFKGKLTHTDDFFDDRNGGYCDAVAILSDKFGSKSLCFTGWNKPR